MLLGPRLRAQGDRLFRWRSYLPLILLPAAILALLDSGFLVRAFGELGEEAWDGFAFLVAVLGFGVRVLTVGFVPSGTSGRNTREQRANVLNTSGAYSMVRNPLYLGNFLMLVGFALDTQSCWFALVACLAFTLYYERIVHAEETFLAQKFGAEYLNWAERTPAFLPNLRLWRRPDLPFSLRAVLRREYNGFYLIVVVFFAMDAFGDLAAGGESVGQWLREDSFWPALFAAGSVAYLVLRLLKKKTAMLTVAGR
jgi:protein-S-isoprenylcysteine O-methyltransferase Ste14